MLDNGAYPICIPCVCRVSAKAFPIQDEPFLRDQRLQQVDTIIALLQDKMYSVKTKHHPPERPAKRGAIRVIKLAMNNRILGQAIDQAKQELKTVQPQIDNDKSSPQFCNCDYDQLLNSIVHEQVDVNRRIMISTANDVSRYCDSNPHAHHNRTADRPRFPSNKSPALNSKTTTTPS